jgi:hypothetical protein
MPKVIPLQAGLKLKKKSLELPVNLVFLPEGCHSGQAERDPESRFFKQFWIPACARMTALRTFAETSLYN